MNRLLLPRLQLTEINGRLWIYEPASGRGWFVEIEEFEGLVDPVAVE